MTEPVESIVTGIDWGASDKDESVYCEVRLDEKTGIMTITGCRGRGL